MRVYPVIFWTGSASSMLMLVSFTLRTLFPTVQSEEPKMFTVARKPQRRNLLCELISCTCTEWNNKLQVRKQIRAELEVFDCFVGFERKTRFCKSDVCMIRLLGLHHLHVLHVPASGLSVMVVSTAPLLASPVIWLVSVPTGILPSVGASPGQG